MFAKGTIHFVDVTSDYAVFEREDKEIGEKAVIIMNRSKKKITRPVSELVGDKTHNILHGREEGGNICTEPFGYSVIIVK